MAKRFFVARNGISDCFISSPFILTQYERISFCNLNYDIKNIDSKCRCTLSVSRRLRGAALIDPLHELTTQSQHTMKFAETHNTWTGKEETACILN